MTSQQSFTQLAQDFIEAFNTSDWTRFKATLAPNVNYEETGTQRRVQDADAYVQLCQGWKQAFCYRTENPFAICSAVGRSRGRRKLTGTATPSRSAYCMARRPI